MDKPGITKESLRSPGMRDLLPADTARFRRVEETFRSVCAAWGYREMRTPTVERLHLFTTAGTLSPQMLGRVYSFLDWDGWSGERVVLRPDATIAAARLFVEHLQSSHGAAKLFYVQNVFRFTAGDEPREVWQCGAELIGDSGRPGDLELMLMALTALERLNTPNLEVLLSHAAIPRVVLAHTGLDSSAQSRFYDRLLDGDASGITEIAAQVPPLSQALYLLFASDGGGSAYCENLRAVVTPVLPELHGPLADLALLCRTLEALGYRCRVVPALVHNFEYYTGTIFHFASGETRVGGGGRYDDLVSLIGGDAVPASGFALDMDALMRLLPPVDEPMSWPQGVLLAVEEESAQALAAAFRAARRLHGAGLPATVAPGYSEPRSYRWELVVRADGSYVATDRLDGSHHEFASLDQALTVLGGRR